MTEQEYLETVQRIQEVYNGRREEALHQLEVEQEKDLLALIRVWKVQHDGAEPPWMGRALKTRPPRVSSNGDQPVSQKQRIRNIIEGLPGLLDSAKVQKRFGEVYPDENQPETSTISKVFREMVKEEKLECTKPAGFQQPAQYEKT